jgi:hypothetical protein
MSQFSSPGGFSWGRGPPVGPAADGRGHPLDLADASGAHERDGQEEDPVVIAALLGADLHDAARLLGDPAERLALVDRQRQRLLAVDVLARLHGVDADLGVPVVGRADDDGVDVLAVEELAVVLVDVGLPSADVLLPLARSACRLSTSQTRGSRVVRMPPGRRPCPGPPAPIRPRRGRSFLARVSSAIVRPAEAARGKSSGLSAETRRKSSGFCVFSIIVANSRQEVSSRVNVTPRPMRPGAHGR